MKRYVLFLGEIDLGMITVVGGKAANLGQLTRWGFRVPDGFCVTTSALDAVMDCAGLREDICRMAAGLSPRNLVALEKKTTEMRERIEQERLPTDVEAALRNAWGQFQSRCGNEPRVAVRSSVGTRDGRRSSFPGQMDTYHNLSGFDAVLHGIRRCWASAWTARAACTRLALGLGPEDVIIAPLVQEMVPSDTAGVLFTAHPLSGRTDLVLVNAAYGLGEAVVGGAVTPDQYLFAKTPVTQIERTIGNKPFRVDLDLHRGTGTLRVALGREESLSECLSTGQLHELVTTGLRIEACYGGKPQDVEWAFFGGNLFVLQSRDIAWKRSVAQPRGEGEAPVLWKSEFDTNLSDPPCTYTSANISEVLPGVLTPLTSSGLKHLDYGFWKPNHDLGLCGIPFPEDQRDLLFLGVFYGRPHLNLTRFREIASQIPGGSVAEFDRPFPENEPGARAPLSFRVTPRSLFVLLRFAWRAAGMLRRVPRGLKKASERVVREYREFRQLDLSQLPVESLVSKIQDNRQDALSVMVLHIENSLLAVSFYELLRKLCFRWLGDGSGATAARLVTGLTTLESARPNREIFRLYRSVESSPVLTQRFLQPSVDRLWEDLRKEDHPEVRGFLTRLDAFLDQYGYRSVNEAELMLPSWDRDPGFVFSMIRNLLLTRNPEDPEDVEHRRAQERLRAVADASRKLSPDKRAVFRWVLSRSQTFIAGREKNKALLMMGIHGVKNVFFELSRRLKIQGVLREREDLYFLTEEEIVALCRGGTFDPYDRIPGRRVEWERNRQIRLPETFCGQPVPLQPPESAGSCQPAGEKRFLSGLAVSPGRVTGKARVILDPRTDAYIEQGEILVAPVTDAGWTPLFLIASAIVVDVGGLLSHGSIVAREYGIPGVLNVLCATTCIRTGQTITVDGDRGEVWVHEDTG
jgi:rifampicin phosphotransferase